MHKFLTLQGLGALPWAGEFSVCVDELESPSDLIGSSSQNNFVLRTQLGETSLASVNLTVDPATSGNLTPVFLCMNRGLPIPLICPHCSGRLSRLSDEAAQAHRIPTNAFRVYCGTCGEDKGIYIEKTNHGLPSPVLDLTALITSWRSWLDNAGPVPLDWNCAICEEKDACYGMDNPMATQRLVLLNLSPIPNSHNPIRSWPLPDLSEFIAGRPFTGQWQIGATPWVTKDFSIPEIFTLKLKLFDALLAGLLDYFETYNKFPLLTWDAISVSVGGSPRSPCFLMQFVARGVASDQGKPRDEKFRHLRAKFQVTSVGTAENPHINAILHLPAFEDSLEVGAEISVAISKEDGLPADCTLKFRCTGGQPYGEWRLNSAETIATPLLQYFRILRVVPAFDVNVQIPIASNLGPTSDDWLGPLGVILTKMLFVNGGLSQSVVEESIQCLSREIGPETGQSAARQLIAAYETFQSHRLSFNEQAQGGLDSSVLDQPILGAARWIRGLDTFKSPVETIEAMRREIYHWLSMRSLNAMPTDLLGESDEELIEILKELAIDLGMSPTVNSKKSEDRSGEPRSANYDKTAKIQKTLQKTSGVEADLESTMVLTRDEISRLTAAQKISSPIPGEPDLDSTMVISPGKSAMPARNGGRAPYEQDTQVALDETVVISRNPKPR